MEQTGDIADIAAATFYGATPNGRFGWTVVSAGDLDGDGNNDLLVGAPGGDADPGTLFVFHGPFVGDRLASSAEATLQGENPGDAAGWAAATADLDGDGIRDIVVGAPEHTGGGLVGGAVYVTYGPLIGDYDLSNANGVHLGEALGDKAGFAIALIDDTDGDGHPDLLVGAPDNQEGGADQSGNGAGKAYLVRGDFGGSHSLVDADVHFVADLGLDEGGHLGYSVASAGDFNGDGAADIVLGAPLNNTSAANAGAAYLFLAVAAGVVAVSEADLVLTGEFEYDYLGAMVTGALDLDGDGLDELALGAPGFNDGADDFVHPKDGAMYIVTGSPLMP